MSAVIFHLPYLRHVSRVDASIARPTNLIDAFKERGHEVFEISGLPRERRRAMRDLRRRLKRGERFDLFYSEAHSIPNVIANWKGSRVLQSPVPDYRLFSLVRRHGIPSGLFLRDVEWRSRNFMTHRPRFVRSLVKVAYWLDLLQYRRTIDVLYIPSEPVRQLVPLMPRERMVVLRAAGAAKEPVSSGQRPDGPLRVIYVGNVDGNHYRFHRLLEGAANLPGVELTLNVPAAAWQEFEGEYADSLAPNMRVTHEGLAGLAPLLAAADIGALYYAPDEYRRFSFPAKILEYCAYGLPIISDNTSFAGEYVTEHRIGWVCAYETGALATLLRQLSGDLVSVGEASERARNHAEGQTWGDRVDQVCHDLHEVVTARRV